MRERRPQGGISRSQGEEEAQDSRFTLLGQNQLKF